VSATGPVAAATTGQPRKRRNAELVLVLFALGLSLLAYLSVGFNRGEPVDLTRAYPLGGLAVLVLVAHLVLRVRAPYADPVLLPSVTLLNGLGLVLIHVVDAFRGASAVSRGRPAPPDVAATQLVWTALGIALFTVVVLAVRDHRVLARFTYTAGFAAIALLLLPLVPVLGATINGARIWVSAGGLSFQPGEIAKILLALFFAGYLAAKRDALAVAGRRFVGVDLPRGRDLGPILAAWAVSLGVLVLERDLGASLLLFGLFVVMLYVATERVGWVLLGIVLFAAGAFFAYSRFGYVRARVSVWLNPFADPSDSGFQIVQSLYGLANGGLVGTGLGRGQPTLVPLANSDFIATTLGESLGLAGLMAVIVLYGLVVERGLRTSLTCRDPFGKLLALGLSFTLALQTFVVVGGVTRLIPLTGLTTPFLSAGGSSLVANWVVVALLVVISDGARRPVPAAPAVPGVAQAAQAAGGGGSHGGIGRGGVGRGVSSGPDDEPTIVTVPAGTSR